MRFAVYFYRKLYENPDIVLSYYFRVTIILLAGARLTRYIRIRSNKFEHVRKYSNNFPVIIYKCNLCSIFRIYCMYKYSIPVEMIKHSAFIETDIIYFARTICIGGNIPKIEKYWIIYKRIATHFGRLVCFNRQYFFFFLFRLFILLQCFSMFSHFGLRVLHRNRNAGYKLITLPSRCLVRELVAVLIALRDVQLLMNVSFLSNSKQARFLRFCSLVYSYLL